MLQSGYHFNQDRLRVCAGYRSDLVAIGNVLIQRELIVSLQAENAALFDMCYRRHFYTYQRNTENIYTWHDSDYTGYKSPLFLFVYVYYISSCLTALTVLIFPFHLMNNSYVPIYNHFEEVMLESTYWLHFYKELWISIWEIISNASLTWSTD